MRRKLRLEESPFDDADDMPAIFKSRGQQNHRIYQMQTQILKNAKAAAEQKQQAHQAHILKRQQICDELNDNGIPQYKKFTIHDSEVQDYQAGVKPMDRHYYYFAEPKKTFNIRRLDSIDDILLTNQYPAMKRYMNKPTRWGATIFLNFDQYFKDIGANQVNRFKLVHHHNSIKLAVLKLHWLLRALYQFLWNEDNVHRVFGILVRAMCDYNVQRYASEEITQATIDLVTRLNNNHMSAVVAAILEAECVRDHHFNLIYVTDLLMLAGMPDLFQELLKRLEAEDVPDPSPEPPSVVNDSLVDADDTDAVESTPLETTPEPELTPSSTQSNTPLTTSPITPVSRERHRKPPKPKRYPPIDQLQLRPSHAGVLGDSSLHALDHIARLRLPDRVAGAALSVPALTPLISHQLTPTAQTETTARLIKIRDIYARFKNQFVDANRREYPHQRLMAWGLGVVLFWIMVLETKIGLVNDDIFYGDKQRKRRKLHR